MGVHYNLIMKKVIIRAPLLTYSGYGTHSRQIFRWLLSRPDIQVYTSLVPWGMTPWMINPGLEEGLIEEIMSRSAYDPKEVFDVSIQVQLPNEWDPTLAKKNVGISAFVETDICNSSWVECCNRMSHIIVPSNHVHQVIKNSGGSKTPVSVVPESFYDAILHENLDEFFLDVDTKFNFLIFGQLTAHHPDTDRKNTFNTIKWLCETFKDDPDVGVIIKTNSGKNTTIDKRVTVRTINKLVNEVRVGPYPKIHVLHGPMDLNEIASLYRDPKIKALVSLTRGEGFGLPLLEAAASGLPVIATNWSGHLDFLKMGKFIPVDFQVTPIPEARVDGNIFVTGAKWAEPIESSAKQRFQKFRKAPSIPHRWAKELSEKIRLSFSQDKISQHYDEVLGNLI